MMTSPSWPAAAANAWRPWPPSSKTRPCHVLVLDVRDRAAVFAAVESLHHRLPIETAETAKAHRG